MQVDDYSFGAIVIDGRRYTRDVLILPGRILSPWWRKDGHRLDVADIEPVLAAEPEVFVIGTGSLGRMRVPPETLDALNERGIMTRALPTGEAVKVYNGWVNNGRSIAAGFHLTC